MTSTIGFIGLGAMGALMLDRMANDSGSDKVLGFDANADVMDRVCRESGAVACRSITEIASQSDLLISCLPNDDILRTVFLGENGVSSALKPGSISIDCSTVSPNVTIEISRALKDLGVDHLDACMLGSVKQAREGTISFLVGGNEGAVARAIPFLERLGGLIRHCGSSGGGNKMKLVHQTLVAGHAVAVAEALTLCKQTGTDIEAFYDIVTQGTGFAYSRYFEQRVPRMQADDFSPLFMLRLMAKDARLARDMLPEDGPDPTTALPALQAAISTLEEGERNGFGDLDFSAAMKVLDKRFSD